MMRATWLAAGIVLVSAAVPRASFAQSQEATERPNIVLIVADDLGYGELGCYGQQRIQTPHLDRMAAEGMRFTDFYAGSTVCAPSRCVLMTGRHVGHATIRGNSKQDLRPEDVTVAEVLQAAGYRTALCGKWGLGHEGSSGVPTRQGFDYFFGYLDQQHAHNYYPAFLMQNEMRVSLKNVVPGEGDFGGGVATVKADYSHDLISEEALAFIERERAGPFFLYLAWTIPHANNEGGRLGMETPDLGEYANLDWPEPQKAHAAMISRMDRDLGRLLERLAALGIEDRTLVLFTSDNGPHREGGADPEFNDSSGPLKGIKRSLHEGGIRVPFIARWPGHVQAGATSAMVGSFADLLPTLAEIAGASTPADCDGLSLAPTLLGVGEQQPQAFLYWSFYEQGAGQAIRLGRWKGIQQPYRSPLRIYDLENDLGEEHDLAESQPALVETLSHLMRAAHTPSPQWRFPQEP